MQHLAHGRLARTRLFLSPKILFINANTPEVAQSRPKLIKHLYNNELCAKNKQCVSGGLPLS